jgi:hypothetical protein
VGNAALGGSYGKRLAVDGFICNTRRVLDICDLYKNPISGGWSTSLGRKMRVQYYHRPHFWRKDLMIDNVLLRER